MSSVDLSLISALYSTLLLLSSYVNKEETKIEPYKTVSTEYGMVRGRLETSYLNQKPYYSFKGIPYAKPPIGELRFKVSLKFCAFFLQVCVTTNEK